MLTHEDMWLIAALVVGAVALMPFFRRWRWIRYSALAFIMMPQAVVYALYRHWVGCGLSVIVSIIAVAYDVTFRRRRARKAAAAGRETR